MIEKKVALLALGAVLIAGPAFGDADCNVQGNCTIHTDRRSANPAVSIAVMMGNGADWQSPVRSNPSAAARSCAFNGSLVLARFRQLPIGHPVPV